MADVDLEVRRLGGVLGVLKLLRPPSSGGAAAAEFCADRIELGAAILACRARHIPPAKTCGSSSMLSTGSSSNIAEERGEQELVSRHCREKDAGAPWEARALITALDALQEGVRVILVTVPIGQPVCGTLVFSEGSFWMKRNGAITVRNTTRINLLRVVGALGCHIQGAEVIDRLFDIIASSNSRSPRHHAESCRYVTRALAQGLHHRKALRRESASAKCIVALLALAFPVRLHEPSASPDDATGLEHEATSTAGPDEYARAIEHGYQETRENALSCICSITRGSQAAVKTILESEGIMPLYSLAMEDAVLPEVAPATARRRNQLGSRPGTTGLGDTRLYLNRDSVSTSISQGKELRPSATVGEGRPKTAGAPPHAISAPPLSAFRITTAVAPIADGMVWATPMSVPSATNHRSELAVDKGQTAVSGEHGVPGAAEAVSPVSTRDHQSQSRALGGEGGARTVAGASWQVAQPTQDSQGDRLTLLATKCLLHCLRGHARPPVTRGKRCSDTENRLQRQPSASIGPPVEVEADTNKNAAGSATSRRAVTSGSTPTAHTLLEEERSGDSSLNRCRGPTTSNLSPPGATLPSRRKSSYRQRKNSAATRGQTAARRQRSRKRLSLHWPVAAKATLPTATPEILGVDRQNRGVGDGHAGGNDRGHTGSVHHIGDIPGMANAISSGKIEDIPSLARVPSIGSSQSGGCGVAAAVYAELDLLGAAARVPSLLNASCPLQQELGVTFLATGLRESAERINRYGISRKLQTVTSAEEVRVKRTTGRDKILHVIVMNSGCLRSLCWLLLHRRPSVSEGAATVLDTLIGPTPRPDGRNEWTLSLIEQGCVPLLRMAAGISTAEATKIRTEARTETVRTEEAMTNATGFHDEAVSGEMNTLPWSCTSEKVQNSTNGSDTEKKTQPSLTLHRQEQQDCHGLFVDDGVVSSDVRQGLETVHHFSRRVARSLLAVVSRKACMQHLDRLVRAVTLSGNRELRANVAVGLVLLSVESGGAHGYQARRSFITGGALTAVLGMLRSSTGRPAAVSFLQTVAALIREPAPALEFFGPAAEGDGEGDDEEAGCMSSSEGRTRDTVVLVKDPLACDGETETNSRGEAESGGIKMACPPREVMCRASPDLRELLVSTLPGQLPLLHGHYRTWEEVMAHMGAPHTFPLSRGRYSTPFLMDMFVVAASFRIKGQADGYARELWRRLRQSSDARSSRNSSNGHNNNVECDRHKRNVHALLEASMRCRQAWLCCEAFRESSSVMGVGDGAGLPSHPRELTALLILLQRILSIVFETGDFW